VIAENLVYWILYCSIGGAIINIILNYLLIACIGISGAAISTLIAQFAVVFVIPLTNRKNQKTCWFIVRAFFPIKYIKNFSNH
jgi:Na+-driven multidrug efflux pump